MASILFTLYGIAIRLIYAIIAYFIFPLSTTLAIILSVIIFTIFGLYSIHLAKTPTFSYKQLAILMPFIPFAMFAGIIIWVFLFFAMMVALPFLCIGAPIYNYRFQKKMIENNRYAKLSELSPRLLSGEGTLIEETGRRGPYRIWWTEDDLFSLGSPVSTKEEVLSILSGEEHEFNARCLKEYLDKETGKALLTPIPARDAKSGKLAKKYPSVKIAKIVHPL
jgi:hypothetical protein